jgi:hypothetical protein
MRKRIMMTVTAVAIAATAVLAVPAAASASTAGFGKQINDGCGASYGQLVSTARASGHITGSVGGARNWIESGLSAAHGCS